MQTKIRIDYVSLKLDYIELKIIIVHVDACTLTEIRTHAGMCIIIHYRATNLTFRHIGMLNCLNSQILAVVMLAHSYYILSSG